MEIYTDSSYFNGISGIGILINDGVKQKSISNYIPCSSNNYGELFAIYIGAILSGSKKATIYTDSQTSLDFIKGNIKPKKRKDFQYQQQWINYNNMLVLAHKVRLVNPNLTFEKVKAHRRDYKMSHLNNSMADLLAKKGIAKSMGR